MLFMAKKAKMVMLKAFEYSKIPYTHSGVLSSMNAMNKLISKKIFIKNKIKTPPFIFIKKEKFNFLKILKK